MAKDEEESQSKPGLRNNFEPGSALGPIEDRNEYEQRLAGLMPDQRQLAQESTRLADLCDYFSRQKIDIPIGIVEQVAGLPRQTAAERLRVLVDVNRALMEYLSDVDQNPGIRQ
jgi:hypothetical protein